MRILILSQYFWPETFRITEIAEALVKLGCEVTVLSGQPNYPDGDIFEGYSAWGIGKQRHPDGYDIFRVPLVPRGKGGAVRLSLNYFSFVITASLIGAALLRGRKFNAIFVYGVSPILQGLPALFLRLFKKAPVTIWVQDLWPESLVVTGFGRHKALLAGVRRLVGWIFRRSDLLLTQSPGFEALIRPMAGNVPIKFHPNPAEMAVAKGVSAREPAFIMAPAFNVVFAGNLGSAQALHTIIGAAEKLGGVKEIHFWLIGSGSAGEYARAEAKRRGLTNIQFPGRYPADQMPGLLDQASALLVTLVRNETLAQLIPSKVPTYMATGKPIVAALDGEGAVVINASGGGIAVSAEDEDALSRAILRLHQMPESDRAAMGRAGREYYESNFEPEALAKKLISHFEDALARQTG
jgi:glycosyltransferase involved in cell wall biosynthesis